MTFCITRCEHEIMHELREAKPGERLSNISHAIQKYVEAIVFSIAREYVGRDVGQDLHENPAISHCGPPKHLSTAKSLVRYCN